MTAGLRVCRYCDGLITEPAAAVLLWHEEAVSGPGWDVYAHCEHAELVEMIDSTLLRIMIRIWSAKMQG